MFRTSLIALGALALTACSNNDTASVEAPTTPVATTPSGGESMSSATQYTDTKTKAVLVYADWCGSCKTLDPKLAPVKTAGVPGVEFVTLDYTDKDDADFYAQADAAGVGEAVRDYLDGTVKTGQLLLVDVDDQRVVDVVKKDRSTAEIKTSIMDAVTAS